MVQRDLESVRQAVREKFVDGPSPYEGEKAVWRGDRLEWLLHHAFTDWRHAEVQAGRATVPTSL